MRAQMKEEEKKKSKKYNKTLWVVYVCLIVFVGAMGFIRLIGLLARTSWRNKLDGVFPEDCPDWATHGCTRVVLQKDKCVRANEIEGNNSIVFATDLDSLLNSQIADCIDELEGSKLIMPKDLHKSD